MVLYVMLRGKISNVNNDMIAIYIKVDVESFDVEPFRSRWGLCGKPQVVSFIPKKKISTYSELLE